MLGSTIRLTTSMDDDFFDDDDGTLANLAEDELQALENNAVFQYTQLQHHQQAVGPARSSHLNTWSNTPPRTTTAAQTNAQTRFHSDNYNSRQNVSTYGVGTLAIVPTAGIDQNQNLRSPIPERFDETVEVWNADGPPTTSAAYPGQRHQQSYPSHYGGGIGGGETTYRQQHGHDTRVSEALHQPHQGGYYQQQQHQEATNLYQGQLGNQHDEQYFDQGDVVVDDNTEVDRHHNKGNQWVDYKQQEGSAQAQEFQRMVSKVREKFKTPTEYN